MKSEETNACQIIKNVGGAENIIRLTHCATRLRFVLKDKSKFNPDKIKQLPEILSAIQSGEESQVIVGNEVGRYYDIINKQLPDLGKNTDQHISSNHNWLSKMINGLVNIMAPLITAFVAGGLFKAIISILATFKVISTSSQNYVILNAIADAVFYFLPFLLAVSTAKKFKTNEYIAMIIAGFLLYPSIIQLVSAGKPVYFFGLPVQLVNYSSSVLPIILAIWFMSYLDKFLEKIIPNSIKTTLKPLLILAITAPITLLIIGPIGTWLGDGFYFIIKTINTYIPWLVPTIIGALAPLLVMIGMHVALMPLAALQFAQFRKETIIGPGFIVANMVESGVAFAAALRLKKDKKNSQIAFSSGITALTGIIEPTLYGITLKYKRTLYCAIAAGGLAGLYAGITQIYSTVLSPQSILTLPLFITNNPNNFINAIIAVLLAFTLGFIFTYLFAEIAPSTTKNSSTRTDTIPSQNVNSNANKDIISPAAGELEDLSQVNDETFASKALGDGVAIELDGSIISAPVSGKITALPSTGHAFGITTKDGMEILVHIGIDTVKLNGNGFDVLVQQNDEVEAGEPIIRVDREYIEKKGYDLATMLIITNSNGENIKLKNSGKVNIGTRLN